MAHVQTSGKNSSLNAGAETDVKAAATFHDFLGNKGQESAPAAVEGGRPPLEVSPSSTSHMGSERNTANHLEGIPYFGPKGDISGPESANRFKGYKRSNSDSFMISSRDKFPHGPQPHSQDSPILTKLLRYSGGEGPRRPLEEEKPFAMMHQMRPITPSFASQSSAGGGRTDTNPSKWNTGPTIQYPPHGGQAMPFGYHKGPSNRVKESNVGPSLVSQTAADEGSRTGIKGSGILGPIGASGPMSGRQPSGVLIRSGKQKSGVSSISEPESSANLGQRGTDSGGRQMTIFYGGQAHVFDNVHPNKADVIMALAGSNGGSWSTIYNKPNSTDKSSANDNSDATLAILRELYAKPSEK